MSNAENITQALEYAALGWPVLPLAWITPQGACSCQKTHCKSPGKHPLLINGLHGASVNQEVIRGWFNKYPVANVGIVTGKASGVFVLDIDPKNGGFDSLDVIESKYGKVPDEVLQITGSGGRHYLFRYAGKECRSTTNLWPGIDTRGDGGYIVVSPSNHINGVYFWDAESDPLAGATLPTVPRWLLDKLGEKKTAPSSHPETVTLLPAAEVNKIRKALLFVPGIDDRERWRTIGMSLHASGAGDQAFGLWCEWSQQSDKFDLKDSRRVWESFKSDGGINLATLFGIAKENGYVLPEPPRPPEPPLSAYEADMDSRAVIRPETDSDDLLNPPPILAKDAYHGILRDVVKVACKTSEASPVAVAANFLATFSAMVGRVAFQHIGDGTCHARPFFLLVGRTGKARKGTAEFTVRKIFDAVEVMTADVYPKMKRHEGGLSTGEGLGWAIRDKSDDADSDGTDDKRMMVVEAEFAGAMAAASRERNTLSATIRTCWDGKDIAPLTKNATWCASSPHVCITGHITSEELIHRWDDVDAQSGFLNRFVILHIVRAKLVAIPKPTPEADIERLAALVAESIRFAIGDDYTAANSKEIRMTHDAIRLWCDEYPALTAEQPGIAGALLVRVEIYCRMFAMVFALLDRAAVIEPQHIRAALAWINYWKASVSYIFQTLSAKAEAERLDATSNEVLEFIRENPRCAKAAITMAFKHRVQAPQITAALNHLLNAAPPLINQQSLPRADGKPGKGSVVFWVNQPLTVSRL